MNQHIENESIGVYEQMSLPPTYLLAPVIATLSSLLGRFHGLAESGGGTGSGFSPLVCANGFA
jgi:hypothetical protein